MKNKTGIEVGDLNGNHDAVYLVEVKDNQVISWDGCHSKVEDVEKAYYLWKTLGTIKEDCSYYLIRVKDQVITKEEFNKDKKPKLSDNEKLFKEQVLNYRD